MANLRRLITTLLVSQLSRSNEIKEIGLKSNLQGERIELDQAYSLYVLNLREQLVFEDDYLIVKAHGEGYDENP